MTAKEFLSGFLPIVIGCDCDPDRDTFSSTANRHELQWEGLKYGVARFIKERKQYEEETGIFVTMTWFIRVDMQIEALMGTQGSCIAHYQDLLYELDASGDEIAWHPHLWEYDKWKGEWYQETSNDNFKIEVLERGYGAFIDTMGRKPRTVHAGWCYQDNVTMNVLNRLGLIADCSSIPGHSTVKAGSSDRADWSRAKPGIYRPSILDYQVEGESGYRADILEIPASVGGSRLINIVRSAREVQKRRSIRTLSDGVTSQVPLITLCGNIFDMIAPKAVRRAVELSYPYFLTYMHCDELIKREFPCSLQSSLYSCRNVFRNIDYLRSSLARYGTAPMFVNLDTLASMYIEETKHEQ